MVARFKGYETRQKASLLDRPWRRRQAKSRKIRRQLYFRIYPPIERLFVTFPGDISLTFAMTFALAFSLQRRWRAKRDGWVHGRVGYRRVCQTRIIRTLPKRRYFRAFCQILVWSTFSTSALAFTKNHQKYRRFGCGQVWRRIFRLRQGVRAG